VFHSLFEFIWVSFDYQKQGIYYRLIQYESVGLNSHGLNSGTQTEMRTVGLVQLKSGFVDVLIAIEKLYSYTSSCIDQILIEFVQARH
jgi:hypothetical protein